MAPTVVNVAVGVLIGVALLGAAFDRRSVVIVAVAAALSDVDILFTLAAVGAPNASLHSIFIPLGAAVALYYETRLRASSWFTRRYGWYGVRVAWVAIAAYAIAGLGLDAFTDGVALLYPLSDRYYAIAGRLVLSTQDGIVQTYVTIGDGWFEVASPGTTGTHTFESSLTPSDDTYRLRLIESGWQAVIVLTAVAALPAKYLVARQDQQGHRNGGGR